MLVLVPAQLLAVARDQQQRVVGPSAEDKHRQNAGALSADRQTGMPRQPVDRALGQLVRHAHPDQRDQPQHRTAVGEQEQQRDDADGGEQQGGVDALERLHRVDEKAAWTGDLDHQPVPARADGGPDVLHLLAEGDGVAAAGQRNRKQQRAAVLGRYDGRQRLGDQPGGVDLRPVGCRLARIRWGDAGVAGVDDDHRQGAAAGQLLLQLQRPGGLCLARQVARRVVLLH